MSLLDFWLPLTTSPGPDTLDLYLAEYPGTLVIPISRKNSRGPRTRGAHPRSLRLDLLADAWEVARPAVEADECLHGDEEEIRWRLGMTAEIIKHGGQA